MSNKESYAELSEDFYCSISEQIMFDPVLVIESGHSYERAEIEQWFEQSNNDPMSGAALSSTQISDNHTLRKIIARELESRPQFFHNEEVYCPQSLQSEFLAKSQNKNLNTLQQYHC